MQSQMLKLTINTHFDAAHHLPNYSGACHNLHGHRFNVRIIILGTVDPETGMVVDFKIVKRIINELDHNLLNNIVENPTAENLTIYLQEHLCVNLPKNVSSVNVCIWESPDCSVETI